MSKRWSYNLCGALNYRVPYNGDVCACEMCEHKEMESNRSRLSLMPFHISCLSLIFSVQLSSLYSRNSFSVATKCVCVEELFLLLQFLILTSERKNPIFIEHLESQL